ncbi:V-type proton ATPase subunit C 2 isoform X2 [Sarcophilus harrisii]|uniref:V-type proton ATPase subunit C 2 isoform X2 n=1 Tax=Sarcophilus harrisii TaxID=9305 RepID=UPI001301C67D|nr:V-type proton ATPase subunit C 2 isoform X2 [Sarcophilus harrisii]
MFGKQHMFTSFINVSCYYSDDTLNEGPGPGRLGWKEERLGESQRASRGPASDDLVPYANPQAGGGSEATSRELLGDKTPGGRGGAGGSSWSLNRLGAGARAHQGLIWAKGVAAALQRPRQPAAGGSPALPSPVPAVPKAIPRRSGGAPTPRLPRRIVRIVPNPSSRPPRVSSLSALRPSDAPWHARLLHFAPVTLTKRKDLNMSSEFWLISAPGDKENLQALERMNTVTSKSNLSHNTKFAIPDFKVGTLDSLVGLSDELGKLDTFAESLIKKMAQCVVEVMEDTKGKVYENLLANGVDLTSFVTRFEWDMAKYPAKQPLVVVVDTLAKQLAQIETDLKARTAAYNTLKGNLENLEKKSTGNLFTRTLADIVNKEDFVLDSEYLITLLVIVPKPNYSQWQKRYESLSDMVVPRSTKLIAEDDEGGLFTVTMFRKVINDFKAKAKENKFIVREFFYDEKEIKSEREEMTKLLSEKKQQYQTSRVALKKRSSTFPDQMVKMTPIGNPSRPSTGQTDKEKENEGEGEGPLLRWLKVNFSEAFIAWIHLKALRVFVESVLRYGLPVNFQAVLLQPHKKATKRLREVLNSVFKHLDEVAAASILDASVDIPGLQLNNQDYFPYVYFHIDLSLLD